MLGYVLGTAAMTTTLWLKVRWRPGFSPKREHLRELLGFGGALTGVSLAAAVLANADKLIIPRALGAAQLGLYSLAVRLPELLIVNLSVVAGQVLFPAFASVDREALRRAFVMSLRYAAMVALPLAAFLGVLAEPLIVAAFGDQWRDGADVMRIMCVYAMASPITFVCGTVLKSQGRAGLLLRVSVIEVLIVVPAMIIVVDQGITAVAACHAVAACVVLVLQAGLAMRLIDVPLGEGARRAVAAGARRRRRRRARPRGGRRARCGMAHDPRRGRRRRPRLRHDPVAVRA